MPNNIIFHSLSFFFVKLYLFILISFMKFIVLIVIFLFNGTAKQVLFFIILGAIKLIEISLLRFSQLLPQVESSYLLEAHKS